MRCLGRNRSFGGVKHSSNFFVVVVLSGLFSVKTVILLGIVFQN